MIGISESSLPTSWAIKRLDFVARVKARLGWKGLTASEYVDDGYAFLSTPNIKGHDIDFEEVNYIDAHRFLVARNHAATRRRLAYKGWLDPWYVQRGACTS